MDNKNNLDLEFSRIAVKVSTICIICNLLLCIIKMIGGLCSNSSSLVSDSVNSLFDVICGFIVIAGAKISRKESDVDHPYGHERFESVATIVLAILLFVTAILLGYSSLLSLINGSYKTKEIPGIASIIATIVSIITKEILFFYTKFHAQKINSSSLRASAYDHQSDVISTSGALIGILLSRIGFIEGDLIASILVCVLIIRSACIIFIEAIGQMVDKTCDEDLYNEIKSYILKQKDILGIDMLQVRTFGNRLYIDLEILEDGDKTLKESHDIAELLHDNLEREFPIVKHVMIHVNPK